MELNKMQKIAGIAAIVLAVILIGSIALSAFGKNDATADNTQNGTENVTADANAPKVVMKLRYIFTNDIAKLSDFSSMIESVSDASSYTTRLIRFEKKDVLGRMDELALKNITNGADSFVTKEDAFAVGTEEIPTKPGVYRSVLEIADASGNAAYEEVFVILDTRGATINVATDVVVTAPADKLSEKPVIDESIYKGYDEVDGNLSSKDLNYTLTLMDEAKHEWKLTISYTDRAGNKSAVDYKVTVQEEMKQVADNDSNAGNGENTSNGGTTDSGSSNNGNSGSETTTPEKPSESEKPNEPETPSTSETPSTPEVPDISETPSTPSAPEKDDKEYDPMDANKDGFVSGWEEMSYITPQKQKCIDAGYGVVVEQDGGEWYAILMKDYDHLIDGKRGNEILREYLKERNLYSDLVKGCWINMDNEWYWYTAHCITEIPESDNEEINWDEIEWIDPE